MMTSAAAARPMVAVRKRRRARGGATIEVVPEAYGLATLHGWDIVEEYLLHQGTAAGATRAIAERLSRDVGTTVGRKLVRQCLYRYLEHGDPCQHAYAGSQHKRAATLCERLWIKRTLLGEPDMFFKEVRQEFYEEFAWKISDKCISNALHFDGGTEEDSPMTLKVLERVARQRNADERARCKALLAELPSECFVIIDESSIDRRTWRRRR
eukprot:SAG25_NODE_5672_length_633_cov_0.773408_1_plen_210_part_11